MNTVKCPEQNYRRLICLNNSPKTTARMSLTMCCLPYTKRDIAKLLFKVDKDAFEYFRDYVSSIVESGFGSLDIKDVYEWFREN